MPIDKYDFQTLSVENNSDIEPQLVGNLTTLQVSHLLRMSQQSVIRAFDAGHLRGFRVPGSKFRRIPAQNVERFSADQKIPIHRPTEAGAVVLHPLPKELEEQASEVLGRVPFKASAHLAKHPTFDHGMRIFDHGLPVLIHSSSIHTTRDIGDRIHAKVQRRIPVVGFGDSNFEERLETALKTPESL